MKRKEKQQDRHNPVTRKAWLITQREIRFRLPREIKAAMRQRADFEAMPLSAWVKMAAIKELRRKKAA